MKLVNDVFAKLKGADNVSKTLTGKGSFSRQGFGDLVNALANDTGFKVKEFHDGKEVSLNLSELIRSDIKKSIANAKFPGKTELGVVDSSEVCTSGLSKAIPFIVHQQIATGRKFSLPPQKDMGGDIYLAKVPGRTKTVLVRDIKSKQPLGDTTITTKDSIQVRAKSPVPKHLQTKVRRDLQGKVINK